MDRERNDTMQMLNKYKVMNNLQRILRQNAFKALLQLIFFTAISPFSFANTLCSNVFSTSTKSHISTDDLSYLKKNFPKLFEKIQYAENLIANVKDYEKCLAFFQPYF